MAFYHRVLGIAVLGSVSLLSGCGNFFQCEGKADCPVTTPVTPVNSGDFVYVSNSPSGSTYISGYSLSSGALTAIANADKDLGFVPLAMVVSPNNGFLYVAARADAPSPGAGVYVYTIDSSGGLTLANNGNPFSNDDGIASIDISPDGGYLYTVGNSTLNGVILNEFKLDTTTGLSTAGPSPISLQGTAQGTSSCSIPAVYPLSQECTVKVSPQGTFVAVALGPNGFEVFPYTEATGLGTPAQVSPALALNSADFSLAFDESGSLYVSSTSALTSFGGLGGTADPAQEQSVSYLPLTTIYRPRAVTLSSDYKFVYTANEATSTISGFSLPGAGVMASLGDTAGPTNVSALGVDSTGNYLVAAGFSVSNGLQVFNITSTGALTAAGGIEGTAADPQSADSVPTVMALSHSSQ